MKKLILLTTTFLITLSSFGQGFINENSEIIRKFLIINNMNFENYSDSCKQTTFIVTKKENEIIVFNFLNDYCSDISIIKYNSDINNVKTIFDKKYPRIHDVWCLPNSHITVSSIKDIVFINEISDNGTITDNF